MAEQYTQADTLQYYLTGATSHEGSQSDPDASLGNYRASTKDEFLEALNSSISLGGCSLTVVRVRDTSGPGTGTLTAVDANTVTWTPPSGSAGPNVAIANGQTKLVPGNDKNRYIVITRTSATGMSSSTGVEYDLKHPNVMGFNDVSSAKASSGDDWYRCLAAVNASSNGLSNVKLQLAQLGTAQISDTGQLPASGAGTISTSGSFSTWPDSGAVAIYNGSSLREIAYYSSCDNSNLNVPVAGRGHLGTTAAAGASTDDLYAIPNMRIEYELPSSQPSGNFTTAADQYTAPAGITFEIPVLDSERLEVGDIASGNQFGIWVHRQLPAGSSSEPEVEQPVRVLADAA